MVLFNILVFLISLSVVIILHELGHFVAARRAGILCHEFSLGMGPVLWKTKKGETVYTIRAIPIGGYVMMAGEEVDSEFVKEGMRVRLQFEAGKVSKIYIDHTKEEYKNYQLVTVEKVDLSGKDMAPLYLNEYEVKRDAFLVLKNRELQIAPSERSFSGKTRWQRFWAIFGGPMMNFVLAFFVFLLVNLIVGFPNMESSVIGTVGEGFPADNIIQVGDEIIEVEGNAISSWDELSAALDDDPADRRVDITVLRDGNEVDLTITPIIYFYSIGFHSSPDTVDDLIIGPVTEDTKADRAGLQEGDELLSIDGVDVFRWDDVVYAIHDIGNDPYIEGRIVPIVVQRGDEVVTVNVSEPFTSAFLETQNINIIDTRIGISPEYRFSLVQSLTGSVGDVGRSAGIIFTTLGLLFDSDGAGAGIGVDSLAGPLGIYQITSAALSQGAISLLSWIGLLSVNLGVINLLPIPALDGGRLVFLGYEAITNRKPNQKIENTLHYVMYLALMGLFVFITFNDLLRLLNIK